MVEAEQSRVRVEIRYAVEPPPSRIAQMDKSLEVLVAYCIGYLQGQVDGVRNDITGITVFRDQAEVQVLESPSQVADQDIG